ncbi:HAD family hydrolase [Halobellus sp. EA9]|uniref:HAD family hydrolase n=1 Tax=Halobellus sp. EA9 TaxID=3421647 RepID=UPI003EBD4F2E
MEYDAVVFDNDGVLVERPGVELLRSAAREAFAAVGVENPADEDVEAVAYGVTPETLERVCGAYGVDVDDFWAARERTASAAQIGAMEGGETDRYPDIDVLDDLAVPLGIVSTNQQATIDAILRHHGLESLFGTAYGREPTVESLRRKKPAPYYLERALDDLGAESALFVGDSETDVLAAHRAGVDSAFLRRPHRADTTLDAEPTYELDSLRSLRDLPGVTLREN